MRLQIINLTKILSGNKILDSISLDLQGGRVYGFSGINGSGKTMLMRAVCGLIKPSQGQVLLDGACLGKEISFPPSVGALIENPAFIPKYTGFHNLKILAEIQHKISEEEIRETLSEVGLNPEDKRPFRKYSLGMKQRLGIACAVMEKPDLILMDEPMNALDESGAEMADRLLQREKARGALILLSAHDKDALERLSDEIFTIEAGKITDHRLLEREG